MNNPLKQKESKLRLNKPALVKSPHLEEDIIELRKVINSDAFNSLLEKVLATTFLRYPTRDSIKHIQDANLSSRESINQFINDLFSEVNVPDLKEETEQYQ